MSDNVSIGGSGVPIPIPGTPVSVNVDLVELVNGILDCYKEVKVAQELQATERARIREQSRVFIAVIEADTKKFEMALKCAGAERMVMVTSICDLLNRNVLDDNSVKVCELTLNYLSQSNPLAAVGNSNQMFLS
jgi:hypothetical protein